ncbi:MAG: DNRLRE domain-containing protein, partial [Actinomycetota bacterium]|nr:DNRLRE domain-containing protein [Actinomycetota bacterium]
SSRGTLGAVSYLRYTIPAAPAGKTLRSAALQIRTTTESFAGSANAHAVMVAGNSWTETGLTWNVRPAVTTQVVGTIAAGTAPNAAYSTPLNAAILQSFAGSSRTFAVTSTGTDNLYFWSNDHSATSYGPQLVLTYS